MSTELVALLLEYYRTPLNYPQFMDPTQPLPALCPSLVQALGTALRSTRIEATAANLGTTPAQLKTAALFFIQQVLLTPGADYYRMLGLEHNASKEKIRQHYYLLVRLCHPDKTQAERMDSTAMTTALNVAYDALRTPENRRAYDRQRMAACQNDLSYRSPPRPTIPAVLGLMPPHRIGRSRKHHVTKIVVAFSLLLSGALLFLVFMDNTNTPVLLTRVDPGNVPAPTQLQSGPLAEKRSAQAGLLADKSVNADVCAERVHADSPRFLAIAGDAPQGLDSRPATLIIERLVYAYERGDLDALWQLFASEARINGNHLTALFPSEYATFFQHSSERCLIIRNLSWRAVNQDWLIGKGVFEVSTRTPDALFWRRYKGKVRFELRKSANAYRVVNIVYSHGS